MNLTVVTQISVDVGHSVSDVTLHSKEITITSAHFTSSTGATVAVTEVGYQLKQTTVSYFFDLHAIQRNINKLN